MAIKINKEKPWARLRLSRKQYEAGRPWKNTPLSREDFEKVILAIPTEIFDGLRLEADAERLIQAVFGENPDQTETPTKGKEVAWT